MAATYDIIVNNRHVFGHKWDTDTSYIWFFFKFQNDILVIEHNHTWPMFFKPRYVYKMSVIYFY